MAKQAPTKTEHHTAQGIRVSQALRVSLGVVSLLVSGGLIYSAFTIGPASPTTAVATKTNWVQTSTTAVPLNVCNKSWPLRRSLVMYNYDPIDPGLISQVAGTFSIADYDQMAGGYGPNLQAVTDKNPNLKALIYNSIADNYEEGTPRWPEADWLAQHISDSKYHGITLEDLYLHYSVNTVTTIKQDCTTDAAGKQTCVAGTIPGWRPGGPYPDASATSEIQARVPSYWFNPTHDPNLAHTRYMTNFSNPDVRAINRDYQISQLNTVVPGTTNVYPWGLDLDNAGVGFYDNSFPVGRITTGGSILEAPSDRAYIDSDGFKHWYWDSNLALFMAEFKQYLNTTGPAAIAPNPNWPIKLMPNVAGLPYISDTGNPTLWPSMYVNWQPPAGSSVPNPTTPEDALFQEFKYSSSGQIPEDAPKLLYENQKAAADHGVSTFETGRFIIADPGTPPFQYTDNEQVMNVIGFHWVTRSENVATDATTYLLGVPKWGIGNSPQWYYNLKKGFTADLGQPVADPAFGAPYVIKSGTLSYTRPDGTQNSYPYKVYARQFECGLAMVRTIPNEDSAGYWIGDAPIDASSAVNVTLPGSYSAVDADGNVSAASTSFSLRNGQAQIFLSSAAASPTDTIAPSTPQNLVLSTATTATNVSLQWQASTDEAGGSGLAGYKIFRCSGAGCTISTTPLGTSASATYGDTSVAPGTVYNYQVRAYDNTGNLSGASNTLTATTPAAPTPDTVQPTVTLTKPTANAIVVGTVTLTATATDNVNVAKVEFYLDNKTLLGTSTSALYTATWDTTNTINAVHTVSAKAYDTASPSNTATTPLVSVTVQNTVVSQGKDLVPPTISITTPTANAVTGGWFVLALATATDDVRMGKVEFYLDKVQALTTSPYAGLVGTSLSADTSFPIHWAPSYASQGKHTLIAKAYDAAGNSSQASVSINIDNTPPSSVKITSPVAGSIGSGIIPISATATDNYGIRELSVYWVDPSTGTGEDALWRKTIVRRSGTTNTWLGTWDTTKVRSGTYQLFAEAYDQPGWPVDSPTITITVNNPALPATSAPALTPDVISKITVTSTSTTAKISVSSRKLTYFRCLTYLLDGKKVLGRTCGRNQSFSFRTSGVANGLHTLTVKATNRITGVMNGTGYGRFAIKRKP